MNKKYIKPSIVVETAVFSTLLDTISVGKEGFGGETGDAGGGDFEINAKYSDYGSFGNFGSWDDDED